MNEAVANGTEQETDNAEKEFQVTRSMYKLLQSLDLAARSRVLTHVVAMLGIVRSARVPELAEALVPASDAGEDAPAEQPSKHGTFAEFVADFDPQTDAEKALAAGYWLQEVERMGLF